MSLTLAETEVLAIGRKDQTRETLVLLKARVMELANLRGDHDAVRSLTESAIVIADTLVSLDARIADLDRA